MWRLARKLLSQLRVQRGLKSAAHLHANSQPQEIRKVLDAGDMEVDRAAVQALTRSHPPNAEFFVLRGRLSYVQNNLQEAEISLRKALELDPSCWGAHKLIAMTYMRLGLVSQALEHATAAECIAGGDPEIRVIIGVVRYQKKEYSAALEAFLSAIEVEENNADAHRNLGVLFFQQGNWRSAAHHFKRFSELNPESFFGWSGHALSLVELGHEDEAWPLFSRAVALAGRSPDPHRDYATVLFNAGYIAEARAQIKAGLAIDPINALLHVAHANCNLITHGNMPEAWAEYEWRLQLNAEHYAERTRRWNGSSCNTGTLLVYAEQGMGDVLLFARYITRLKGLVGKVVLQVPSVLVRLLRMSADQFDWNIDDWIEDVERIKSSKTAYDLEIPLLSLMHACHFPVEKIAVPYLTVDEDLRGHWARSLGPRRKGRLRVGLVWAGNPARREDGLRSIWPQHLAPLGKLDDVDFVSLQKEARPLYLSSPLPMPVMDFTAGIRDFADTAAIMQNLDLVISIDTAAAHLAGALGVPCWVLLSKIPDWRWRMGSIEQPWYGNHRSFVVERQRDWFPLLEHVASLLKQRKII